MLCYRGRISYNTYLLALLISINGISLTSTKCLHGEATEETSDISYAHSVVASGANGSEVNYTITFSWQNFEESILGILTKFEDIERKSELVHNKTLIGIWFLTGISSLKIPSEQDCSQVKGKHFLVTLTGKDQECTIPCGHLSNDTARNLCCLIQEKYDVHSKKTTSITKQASFGRAYRFHLVRYGKDTIQSEEINTQPLFCRDELISRQNFTLVDANKICSNKQKIAASISQSGPPSNVVAYKTSVNMLTHKGEVTYRYQKPYDISEKTNVTNFVVILENNNISKYITIQHGSENGTFYYFTASNVTLGVPVRFTIEPRFQCTTANHHLCTDVGQGYSDVLKIPDINACNQTNLTSRYCDGLASCQDHRPTQSSPASCQCPPGYRGNGISLNITGGQGCSWISYCQNDLCHDLAACQDGVNVTNTSRCSCPKSYYGDGYKNGSGCSPIALPLGISFGVLICIICTSLVTVKYLQMRSRRLKIMELFYSKYLDDGECGDQTLQNGVISGFLGKDREISPDDIEFQEVIGRGSFGVVRKAILNRESGMRIVAVKCIPDAVDTAGKEAFMAEIAQMSTVGKHPNVISMIGLCSKPDCSLGIVVEYMEYGDLQSFLWDARNLEKGQFDSIYNLTRSDVYEIAIQCANGLKYLKDIQIIHGDLAARNVLVTENLRCKLSDFGLSTDVYCVGRIIKAKERKLPLKWVSPERMMEGESTITWRSDIWSFGILLYEIVTFGAPPYPGVPNNHIFNKLEQGYRMERPECCNTDLYSLMRQCWQWKPSRRPSPQSLISELKRIQNECRRQPEDATA